MVLARGADGPPTTALWSTVKQHTGHSTLSSSSRGSSPAAFRLGRVLPLGQVRQEHRRMRPEGPNRLRVVWPRSVQDHSSKRTLPNTRVFGASCSLLAFGSLRVSRSNLRRASCSSCACALAKTTLMRAPSPLPSAPRHQQQQVNNNTKNNSQQQQATPMPMQQAATPTTQQQPHHYHQQQQHPVLSPVWRADQDHGSKCCCTKQHIVHTLTHGAVVASRPSPRTSLPRCCLSLCLRAR